MLKVFPTDKDAAVEPATRVLGQLGETLAAQYLERQNFRLVAANFIAPVGRNRRDVLVNGEIDLIAYDNEILCFIEVKTRRSDEFAAPESAVNLRKQRQIIRAARVYRQIFNLTRTAFRYDVIAIVLPIGGKPQINLLKNFWSESKFRKTAWAKQFSER